MTADVEIHVSEELLEDARVWRSAIQAFIDLMNDKMKEAK